MNKTFYTLCGLLLLALQANCQDKPNIILIMADDMGYEAISANGSESCKTPNIDKLSTEGIRFKNCFSNPICTPSRVKIMTGQYNVRNYVRFGMLDRSQKTFAHQLKAAGYATAIAGKWQLGRESDSPQHFGFDESLLWQHTRSGRSKVGDIRYDKRFVNPMLERNGKEEEYTNGEYGPQLCADFICEFIEKNKNKPFLVYYPMILTHCPFDPTPDSKDWDAKRLGSSTYKGDMNKPQRHFTEMANYADKIIGQIVAQLETSGVRENTLILFTGDNGTDEPIVTPWNGQKIPGGKGTMTDTGTRVPLVANWPASIKEPGRVVDDLVEFTDIMPTLCDATGASLPAEDPKDGVSLIPIFKNNAQARKKDWIHIWYKRKVIVRNQHYALLAKADGSDAVLKKYSGPFQPKVLAEDALSNEEKNIKAKFEEVRARLAKTRPAHLVRQVKKKKSKK